MGLDISMVYRDRIEEIEKQQKSLRRHKKWTKFYDLEREKAKLKKLLEEN